MSNSRDPYVLREINGTSWYYADFSAADLPRYLPGVKPELLPKQGRVRFALGLTAAARKTEVWAMFRARLEQHYRAEEHLGIKAALERVIKFKRNSGIKPATIRELERVTGHFQTLCDQRQVRTTGAVTAELVADYRAEQIGRGRVATGVNSDLQQLGQVLGLLASWGYLPGYDRRWITDVKSRRREKRMRVLTDPELCAILEDPDMGDIFRWLYLTGQRIGVVLKLRVGEIRDGIVHYPPGKHDREHDQVVTPDMRKFIDAHRPSSSMGFMFWRDQWGDPFNEKHLNNARTYVSLRMKRVIVEQLYPDRLHRAEHNGRKDPDKERKTKMELIRTLDLPRVHDIRATCATHLARAGVDLLTITQFIGWEDVSVFFKHYYRRRPEELAKQIPSLEPGHSVTQLSRKKASSK